ncbi:MmgE/PrpD family protein [Streptomyces endophyticus]|uniref:MmgE/PrpD family protein n=1 Tax=Streptomyces endophyticus TaxID=714166 RepID=A0ABU6F4G9_9ACTN|nr:MmgE/PrpD family protein [Streptomyces endophyticus]MEB8337816.1 MmgE/PrpD family protein [Streptomyces endophyticus]
MTPSPLTRLARLITDTTYDHLPEATRRKATLHLLDTLGAGLAGARSEEAGIALSVLGGEHGEAPVWGTRERLTPRAAALVNGVSSHAYEVDDTGGCDHSGAVVVPAALAAAAVAAAPVSGARLLTAIVLGYDVGRRMLEACGGYEAHNGAGWHSTGTCGPFGAAAAAAHVLGLTTRQTEAAIGLASSGSAGLWAFVHDGAMTKRLHAGRAAESGLLAARMAAAGMTGPSAVLDDVWGGALATYAGKDAQPGALTEELGSNWKIMRSSLKPYASCRGTHSSVDALLAVMADRNLDADDIAAVHVRMSPFLHGMCGGRDTASLAAAQLSLPCALAAVITHGHAGLEAYVDVRGDRVPPYAAIERIELEVDEAMAADEEPVVTVTGTDGRRWSLRVDDPSGSPGNPLTETAVREKFRGLAGRVFPEERVRALEETVLGLAGAGAGDARVLGTFLAL